MATITVTIGAQALAVEFPGVSNTKAADTFRAFSDIRGLVPDPETATDAEKTEAVVREWARWTRKVIRHHELDVRQAETLAEIDAEYGLE